MKIIKAKINKVEIQLSTDETLALTQVLNEVCHGFKVNDFEKKIGSSKEKVKKLLDNLGDLTDHISPNNPIIDSPARKKVDNSIKEIIRNKCCLKSHKYNFSFYMRNLDFSTFQIGLIIALSENNSDEVIARTDATVVLIKELQNILISFKDQLSSFYSNTLNTFISCSFFNDFVKINVSSAELCESNSLDKLSVAINFIFKRGKQINSSNEDLSVTSITTLNNILNFIASVENFLILITNNSQDQPC